jgi:hypothetical protein
LTQQRKSCSAIPLSFDAFECVDLAFHLPVGREEGEPGKDFPLVPLQSGNETLDIAESALLSPASSSHQVDFLDSNPVQD